MMAYESKNAGADRNLLLQRNDEKKMSVDNLSPLSTLILVAGVGLEPHDLRVMRANRSFL